MPGNLWTVCPHSKHVKMGNVVMVSSLVIVALLNVGQAGRALLRQAGPCFQPGMGLAEPFRVAVHVCRRTSPHGRISTPQPVHPRARLTGVGELVS